MRVALIILLAAVLLGCDTEDKSAGDLFSIKVTDAAGAPVSGLQVIVGNACFNTKPYINRAETVISLALDEEYSFDLDIYNAKNELVRNLYSSVAGAGVHIFIWDGKDDYGLECNVGSTSIFRCELVLMTPDSTQVVGSYSHNMCLEYFMSPAQSSLGTTDEAGEFFYNEELAFPHLFNPEPQEMFDEDANYVGDFSLIDSINIKLNDPDTGEYIIETVKMRGTRAHHYDLIWDDPQTGNKAAHSVIFDYFEAHIHSDEVILSWGTVMEQDLEGFNIYRKHTPGGEDFYQINSELIEAGNYIGGAEYCHPDPDIMEEAEYYYYKLEAVNMDSVSTFSETIQIEIDDPEVIIPEFPLLGNYPNPFN